MNNVLQFQLKAKVDEWSQDNEVNKENDRVYRFLFCVVFVK